MPKKKAEEAATEEVATEEVAKPTATEVREEKKAAKASRLANLTYVAKPLPKGVQMSGQRKNIIDILGAAGEKGLKRPELLAAMSEIVETRQPIERILGYYTTRLVADGLMVVIDPTA